jgi:hypothetical protein
VLSQPGGLYEVLQRELAPASAVARVTEQLVPLSCLGHHALLLAAHPVKQSTQFTERVGDTGIAASVAAKHHDYQDRNTCCTEDVADQQAHGAPIGGGGVKVEICPIICIHYGSRVRRVGGLKPLSRLVSRRGGAGGAARR